MIRPVVVRGGQSPAADDRDLMQGTRSALPDIEVVKVTGNEGVR
ncbi:hypothetical protein [Amycolatopsis jiangsuensis]|uniref:Uncharacterized protein n=1 Tax=Amycolatopsis jiangsuensis TaxID=1181879 RepID=A0A840IX42_9PSEU|nr:hypothetical protein [Amycolatopsis jiangsuensis]MBB4685995.1 hypothetical protein [Amycolatopsis jiangsuensis]